MALYSGNWRTSQIEFLLKERDFISLAFIPFQLYSRWLDSQNYVESTRHWYAQLLCFPFSLLYLSWSHRSVQRWLMAPAPPECTEEQRGMEVRGGEGALLLACCKHSLTSQTLRYRSLLVLCWYLKQFQYWKQLGWGMKRVWLERLLQTEVWISPC